MRFYLAKDKNVEFHQGNPFRLRQLERLSPRYRLAVQREDLKSKFCKLRATTVYLISMMSEQRDGNGFWNVKTVDKCGTLLMDELMKSSSNCNRLDAAISITCKSKEDQLKFSVTIEKCDMLRDIFKTCGEKGKVIVEFYFKMPFTGEATLAGLVTPEMSITCKKGEFICTAKDIKVTEVMNAFWKKNTSDFGSSAPRIFASCNILLIVSDDLPLFQTDRSYDTNRRLFEEAIHSDFEIIASDGAVVKCHKSFLAVHSPVLARMLESDMTESRSSRMKVEDMDKSVVVALLQFLYCKDLPANNLSLSLKLLKVAHMYEINQLEQAMLNWLIQMQDVYFTAEFAWQVYMFVRNIPNGSHLKVKVMKILDSERAISNGKICDLVRDTNDGSPL